MPLVGVLFVLGVVAVLYGIVRSVIDFKFKNGIWFAGVGTVVTVMMLLVNAGLNNTAYYPSSYDLQSSLTIYNSSSSYFTLSVMAVVSLLVPVVLGYIIYAWRSLEKKKLSSDELNNDGHAYYVKISFLYPSIPIKSVNLYFYINISLYGETDKKIKFYTAITDINCNYIL